MKTITKIKFTGHGQDWLGSEDGNTWYKIASECVDSVKALVYPNRFPTPVYSNTIYTIHPTEMEIRTTSLVIENYNTGQLKFRQLLYFPEAKEREVPAWVEKINDYDRLKKENEELKALQTQMKERIRLKIQTDSENQKLREALEKSLKVMKICVGVFSKTDWKDSIGELRQAVEQAQQALNPKTNEKG